MLKHQNKDVLPYEFHTVDVQDILNCIDALPLESQDLLCFFFKLLF